MCFLTGLRLLKRKLKMHRKRGIKVHHSERDKTECSEDIPSQTHQPRLMRCIIELRFRLHAFVRLAAVCRMSFGLKPSCLRRFSSPAKRFRIQDSCRPTDLCGKRIHESAAEHAGCRPSFQTKFTHKHSRFRCLQNLMQASETVEIAAARIITRVFRVKSVRKSFQA